MTGFTAMRVDSSLCMFCATDAIRHGQVELIVDAQHLRRVVLGGMLQSRQSPEIATADFKAMMVPASNRR